VGAYNHAGGWWGNASVRTNLKLRLKYPKADLLPSQPLIVKVFANTTADEGAVPWTLLVNDLNEESAVIPTVPGMDAAWQTFAYSKVDNAAHSWDCAGYSHFVVGVQRPYAIEGPAELQAKIV